VDFASSKAIVESVIRKLIRSAGLMIAHVLGTRVRDFQSGRILGKALIIPWCGRIYVIGLDAAVRPMFQPQKRLTYWKQEIVFTVHPPPDFPNERSAHKTERKPVEE
jgi:hypothetical protein